MNQVDCNAAVEELGRVCEELLRTMDKPEGKWAVVPYRSPSQMNIGCVVVKFERAGGGTFGAKCAVYLPEWAKADSQQRMTFPDTFKATINDMIDIVNSEPL